MRTYRNSLIRWQAQDRVENGDYRVAKDGKLIRVPMGGKELVISGATVYDKRQLLRNQPTSISGSDNKNIVALAKEFRKLSRDHRNIQDSVVAVEEDEESTGKD